jgi:hypothetical protein
LELTKTFIKSSWYIEILFNPCAIAMISCLIRFWNIIKP